MRSLTVLIVSLMNTSIVAWWWGISLTDALPAILVISGVSAGIWLEVGRQARKLNTRTQDAVAMGYGVCPVCETPGSLVEVTSHTDGKLVGCKQCGQRFDIRSSERGPVVMRLGTPTDE